MTFIHALPKKYYRCHSMVDIFPYTTSHVYWKVGKVIYKKTKKIPITFTITQAKKNPNYIYYYTKHCL